MDKQDDEQAAGDDLLDITVDTPFDRSTDQIVALNSPFNIDDTFALHLYDGSVSQNSGDDLYSGLGIIGPVETGTEYMIIQDGKVLPAFWGTGINPEASPSLVFSRHLVKSREGGADIDGKRITVLARELGDQYRRFPVTLGTGNSVAAIGNGADIFNTNTDVTLAGYTSIVNTEGFQELNIDGTGAAGQEFYSQWDKGTQTINDTYERTKWISQRAHTADTNAETGNDFIIDDNDTTTLGIGTEFSATAAGEILTGARLRIKIGTGTPTGTIYAELFDSDDVATAAPTGTALARSERILASSITSSYEDVIFRFNRLNPDTGVDQRTGATMVADQEYFIVLKHDEGTATDYFHAEGDTTTADDGNFANLATVTWTGTGTSALNFDVYSSPAIHGLSGEIFQGINVESGFDTEIGTGIAEDEIIFWGSAITYDTLVSTFQVGEYVWFADEGAPTVKINGGKVLHDTGTIMYVALETVPGGLTDNDVITGITTGATAAVAVTIADQDKGGGEGIILAKDDNGATGEVYLQVLSGINPVDDNVLYSQTTPGSNQAIATATINTRTLNPEFLGTSTGSNIIGAYGIGFDTADVGASDLFTSLDTTSRQPPNNQTFTVSGLVSGEDRVLVGPRTGSALDRGQFLLNAALTSGTTTAIVVKAGTEAVGPIANDIPDDGSTVNTRLRVQLDTGIYRRQAYTSITRGSNQFNIVSTDYSGANQAAGDNEVFVAFIDVLADATTEAFTATYVSDRDLLVRVRDGGGTPIKTFEATSAQFLSTPQTVAAVRTSDA
jgi:hypothetical protein